MTPEAAANSLLTELLGADGEDQVAYRDGDRLVARLKHSRLEASGAGTHVGIRKDGSYLIVGGLGRSRLACGEMGSGERSQAILFCLAGLELAATQVPSLRSAERAIREIEALGTKVTVVVGDVASSSDMTALSSSDSDGNFRRLRGVIHAATVINATKLWDLTEQTIDAMLRPKVLGTWVLHKRTKNLNLDFFLVFSSAASLLGGQRVGTLRCRKSISGLVGALSSWVGTSHAVNQLGNLGYDAAGSIRGSEPRSAKAGFLQMPSQRVFNMFRESDCLPPVHK